MFSKRNWFITGAILFFAVGRLAAASVTTAEMVRLKTFTDFRHHYKWVFTLGLALSSAVDVLITGSLFYYLKQSKRESATRGLDQVIDSLIRYTFENGSLTAFATILSMICWITMPTNFIFMGLHFFISKLYANSLLVTLNTRKTLGRGRSMGGSSGEHPMPAVFGSRDRENGHLRNQPSQASGRQPQHARQFSDSALKRDALHVNITKTIDVDVAASDPGAVSASVYYLNEVTTTKGVSSEGSGSDI